jgi:glutaminase
MSGEVRRTSRTPYVSTGHLPSARQVQATVDEAYRLYRTEASGAASQTYPALARVPGQLSGICVAGLDGGLFQAGDSQHEFTIMSVAKPFALRWCARSLGAEPVRQKPGVNATGLAFNSLTSVERSEGKWAFLAGGLSRFAGRELTLSDEVHASASETSHRNRAIANLLASRDRIYWDPAETVDLYTRQSCLLTSAKDLAVMTATLADGGGSPVTRIQVITPTPANALAVMAVAGMYETSGDRLFGIGVPARAGPPAGSSPSRRARAAWAPSPRSRSGCATRSLVQHAASRFIQVGA